MCYNFSAELLDFHKSPVIYTWVIVKIDVPWEEDGRKLLFYYFDDVTLL